MSFKSFLLICIAIVIGFLLCIAIADEAWQSQGVFVMPKSLISIEESAFENTGAHEIYISESVIYIGNNAFSNSNNLSKVFIPKATLYIGDNAFNGTNTKKLKVYGYTGSYAHKWATEHGLYFFRVDIIAILHPTIQGCCYLSGLPPYNVDDEDCNTKNKRNKYNDKSGYIVNRKQMQEMYPLDCDFP